MTTVVIAESSGLRNTISDDTEGKVEQANAACVNYKMWKSPDGKTCSGKLKYNVKRTVWDSKGDSTCVEKYTGEGTSADNLYCAGGSFHFTWYKNTSCSGSGTDVTLTRGQCFVSRPLEFYNIQAYCSVGACARDDVEVDFA